MKIKKIIVRSFPFLIFSVSKSRAVSIFINLLDLSSFNAFLNDNTKLKVNYWHEIQENHRTGFWDNLKSMKLGFFSVCRIKGMLSTKTAKSVTNISKMSQTPSISAIVSNIDKVFKELIFVQILYYKIWFLV